MKCEACGKEHDGSYGSGRFCCRSCANTRQHTDKTKQKIRNSVNAFDKQGDRCPFCNKWYQSKRGLLRHKNICNNNPNKVTDKSTKLYKMRNGDILNVTNEYIDDYLKNHSTCEICGKNINEVIHSTKKYAPKRLCIDHDHNTNKFRGLLCPRCNSFLGWYEDNIKSINDYLNKAR